MRVVSEFKRGVLRKSADVSVDLSTNVAGLSLHAPILTAAGTAGHGAELRHFFDLSSIGGVVVKSLGAQPWAGNPAPRVWGTDAGMINSVGLQNEGVAHWLEHDLPLLKASNATIIASIWGFTVEQYHDAATLLRPVIERGDVAAVEVNVSCPNIEDRRHMFAHSTAGAASVIEAVRNALGPTPSMWAKLSPNVTAITDIVGAVVDAGANAVTLINTVMGMVIDTETRRPKLGAGGGGLSGPAIRPVAVRAIYDVRAQYPDVAIVGAGGVAKGEHALELLMAGANAVEVGTATFYEPAAPHRVLCELRDWCTTHGVTSINELIGAAHG